MQTRGNIYRYVTMSNYRLGWDDSPQLEKSGYKSMHCRMTEAELEASGLGDILRKEEIQQHISGYVFETSVINLSTSNDTNFTHTHPSDWKVVLYYANLEWKSEFYGETMFFNHSDTEVVQTVRYTPGRIVIFDGDTPHSIRPQSILGPQYRFTVATMFKKVKEVL